MSSDFVAAMPPNQAPGKASWPQIAATRSSNITAKAIAIQNEVNRLKKMQDGTGHGPPKSVFMPFLDAVADLAAKVTDSPSPDEVLKDIKELRDTVDKQARQ